MSRPFIGLVPSFPTDADLSDLREAFQALVPQLPGRVPSSGIHVTLATPDEYALLQSRHGGPLQEDLPSFEVSSGFVDTMFSELVHAHEGRWYFTLRFNESSRIRTAMDAWRTTWGLPCLEHPPHITVYKGTYEGAYEDAFVALGHIHRAEHAACRSALTAFAAESTTMVIGERQLQKARTIHLRGGFLA